jgi:hypothetical protein
MSSHGEAIVARPPRLHRFTGSRASLIGYLTEELAVVGAA